MNLRLLGLILATAGVLGLAGITAANAGDEGGQGSHTAGVSKGKSASDSTPNRVDAGDSSKKVTKAVTYMSGPQRNIFGSKITGLKHPNDKAAVNVLRDPKTPPYHASLAAGRAWGAASKGVKKSAAAATRSGAYKSYGTGNPQSMTPSELETAALKNGIALDGKWAKTYANERERRADLGMGSGGGTTTNVNGQGGSGTSNKNAPGRGDPGGAPNKGDCNCGR